MALLVAVVAPVWVTGERLLCRSTGVDGVVVALVTEQPIDEVGVVRQLPPLGTLFLLAVLLDQLVQLVERLLGRELALLEEVDDLGGALANRDQVGGFGALFLDELVEGLDEIEDLDRRRRLLVGDRL